MKGISVVMAVSMMLATISRSRSLVTSKLLGSPLGKFGLRGTRYPSIRNFSGGRSPNMEALVVEPRPYRGGEINVGAINCSAEQFTKQLELTVENARKQGMSSLYLKVPMSKSVYIPLAGELGFVYHHAEGDTATLLRWLPTHIECKVPPFATHHCGVAGLMVNEENNTILVVKEKRRAHHPPLWKLPGGYVNVGEDFSTASVREVFEETGIKAEFQSLLCFRHIHNEQFGRSDCYFICILKPLTKEIVLDDELEVAVWMPINEFKQQNQHPMLDKVMELLLEGRPGSKELDMVRQDSKRFKMYVPR